MSSYRWVVLAAGTVAAASLAAVFTGVAAIAPALRSDYDLTLTQVGVAIAAPGVGSIFTLLPWGLATDRVGERLVMTAGLLGAAAALLVLTETNGFAALVVLLALAGASGSSVNAASGRAVMGWFDRAERGLALGIRQTGLPIGGALAAIALPPIVSAGGVRWAFGTLAGFCLFGAVAGALFLRDPPRPVSEEPTVSRGPLRDRAMWVLSTGSLLYLVAQIATMNFVVLFLHGHRGMSLRHAADVLAVTQLLGIGSRVAAGRWSDRVGSRLAPLRRVGLALAISMLAAAAVVDAPLAVVVVVFVVAGVLGISWNGLAFTAAAEGAGPGRAGAAIGFQQTMLGIGVAVVPIVFAAVASAASWRIAFGLSAVGPLLGVALLGRLGAR